MKKLSITLVAFLLTAGIAFGQNSVTTTQNGNDNTAVVDQNYTSGGSGDINEATVEQIGDKNEVRRLHQVGAGNDFNVKQRGDNNIISNHTDQGGKNDVGDPSPSFDGLININQYGNANKVFDADQAGNGNVLNINQGTSASNSGSGNVVNVEAQVATGGIGNTIDITQLGHGNKVGKYGDHEPGVYQQGGGNTMSINQADGASAGTTQWLPKSGNYDDAFFRSSEGGQGLIQLGENNKLTINQTGASTVGYVLQDGSANTATFTQMGAGNNASAVQVGSGNTSTITQQ